MVMLRSDPRARLKPCLRCGYSLRNVPDARNCPECGLPVWITLGGNDDLEMSNPQWLGRLNLACIVLAIGHVLLLAGFAFMHGLDWDPFRPRLPFMDRLAVLPLIGAVCLATCGGGWLLIASSEGRFPERARGLRRATMIAGVVTILLAAWLAVAHLTHQARPHTFLVLLVAHAQALTGWSYLQRLARRIPSGRIEQWIRFVNIAIALSLASIVFRGPYWGMWLLIRPWSRYVIGWTLLLIVYPPVATWLLLHVAAAFRRAARAATKNWEPELFEPRGSEP